MVVTSKLATLKELQTFYSLEDAYNMLEIAMVNNHNERELTKGAESGNRS